MRVPMAGFPRYRIRDKRERRRRGQIWCASATRDARLGKASYRRKRLSLLVALLIIASCEPRRPSFMLRVQQDCAAGDKWAYDLLKDLRSSMSTMPDR